MATLRTPEAPATSKQLWLLHILTKTDTRGLKLTMQEASDRIEVLKSNGQNKRPLNKLQPEREVIQGIAPTGKPDMTMIQANFETSCLTLGREKAGNDTATIDFYSFQCPDCLFGQGGNCKPSWRYASGITSQGKYESVSFSCSHYEPVHYSIMEYCHRPKGKRCHRNNVDNKCLECSYRKPQFRDGYNHTANCRYIPTLQQRLDHHAYWQKTFSGRQEDYAVEGLANATEIMVMIQELE